MAEERKSYLRRSLEGRMRTDDGVVSIAPKGRFSLFWEIFKGRFGRLVLVNLVLVLFFAPLVAIIVLRTQSLGLQILTGPFAGMLGVGAGAMPDVTGYAEQAVLAVDLFYFGLLIPALALAGVGVSGGAYLIRNLVRTQGVYDFTDFWRGIKRSVLPVLEGTLLFAVVLYAARIMGDYAELQFALGAAASGWLIAAEVVGYILVGLSALIALWMIALGESYRLGPWALFKNAVVLTFRYIHYNVFFALLALWPLAFILFVRGIFFTIVLIAMVFVGFIYALLVWMGYAQWIIDTKIDPDSVVIPETEEEKAAGKETEEAPVTDPEALGRIFVADGRSELFARPMQPMDADRTALVPLPEHFTREDLARTLEAKRKLAAETQSFEAAHRSEERYVTYNRLFEEKDRALQGKGTGRRLNPPKPRKRRK